MNSWKCVTVLKGDGTPATAENNRVPAAATPPSAPSMTARYYKLGIIANHLEVPWH